MKYISSLGENSIVNSTLHKMNVLSSVAVVATTYADLTIAGGATTLIGGGLSALALKKIPDKKEKEIVKKIADGFNLYLDENSLTSNRTKILAQLLNLYMPTVQDIVHANMEAAQIAALMRKTIEEKAVDPEHTNFNSLNDYENALISMLDPVLQPTTIVEASLKEILKRNPLTEDAKQFKKIDYPNGLNGLEKSFGRGFGFKQFLKNDSLPYFSRDEFARNSESGSKVFSESKYVASLLDDTETPVTLISGPGGVGKTRLALEICQLLKGSGTIVQAERHANLGWLSEAQNEFDELKNLILFLDYGEAFSNLNLAAELVETIIDDPDLNVWLIICCRSSSTQKVEDILGELPIVHVRLGSTYSEMEKAKFEEWVVAKILKHFSIPNFEYMVNICKDLPILAAFASFLYSTDRGKFDEQFSLLADVDSLSIWFKKRISILLNTEQTDEFTLACLSSAVPFSVQQKNDIVDKKQKGLLEALINDRWFDWDEKNYSASHDVFADAMVARFLFSGSDPTRNITRLLSESIEKGYFENCLFAIGRVSSNERFSEIDGLKVVRSLWQSQPELLKTKTLPLLESSLLNPNQVIIAFAEFSELATSLEGEVAAHLRLAKIAKLISNSSAEEREKIAVLENNFVKLLEDAASYPRSSNQILTCAYMYDPSRFLSLVQQRIHSEKHWIQTSFLFREYLTQEAPTDFIRPYLADWLSKHEASISASFIYPRWLDKIGDVKFIRKSILRWLEKNSGYFESDYIFTRLLPLEGLKDDIREYILAWLELHDQALGASFIFEAWLNAKGDAQTLKPHIKNWLKENGTSIAASRGLPIIISIDGLTEQHKETVLAWLELHDEKLEASYIFEAWLNAKGDAQTLKPHIENWLKENGTSIAASRGLPIIISIDGLTEQHKETVLAWLELHDEKLEASYIFEAWLNAKGDAQTLKPHIENWLKENGTSIAASRGLPIIISIDGLTEQLKETVLAWLELHDEKLEASYIFEAWLNAKGDAQTLKPHIENWLKENGTSIAASRGLPIVISLMA